MELILINDSKLKIMLDPDDMKKYDLNPDDADYDNTETRAAFWQILDLAKHECGFDAAKERVFIQLYPSKCGGCELYVTKLPSGDAEGSDSVKRSTARKKGGDGMLIGSAVRREVAYVFDCHDDMAAACRYLVGVGFASESAAYGAAQGTFAITFFEKDRGGGKRYLPRCGEYAPLDEYGRRYSAPAEVAYIKEHAACVFESGAVEKIAAAKKKA